MDNSKFNIILCWMAMICGNIADGWMSIMYFSIATAYAILAIILNKE